jgi:hypothetical protein
MRKNLGVSQGPKKPLSSKHCILNIIAAILHEETNLCEMANYKNNNFYCYCMVTRFQQVFYCFS